MLWTQLLSEWLSKRGSKFFEVYNNSQNIVSLLILLYQQSQFMLLIV